jgi:hypothetical protein
VRIFKERGYSNKYGQVENIRIPFDGVFKKFYYAHLTMKNTTTHTALQDYIRRSEIMFGSKQLVFSKAMSYRPSKTKQLEATLNSSSHTSNDPYQHQEVDWNEFGISKQMVKLDNCNTTCGSRESRVSSSSDSFICFNPTKRPRKDEIIIIKDEQEEKDDYNYAKFEKFEELKFRNHMLKARNKHSQTKLNK